MMERPLLIPLVALIAGICLSAFSGWSAPVALYPISLLLLLSGLLLCRPLPLYAGFALLALTSGNNRIEPYLSPNFSQQHIARISSDSKILVIGVVSSRPELKDNGSRLILDVGSVAINGASRPAAGKLMVYIRDGKVSCLTGDRVEIPVRLKKPRNLGLPGEFDYTRYLSLKGIHMTGFAPNSNELRILDVAVATPFQRRIDAMASRLSHFLDRSAGEREAGILKAVLLGERGSVPADIDELYARGGVNHILSISGFHVGIIALTLYALCVSLLRLFELPLLLNLRRFLPIIIVPILFVYLLLTGAAPATIRSFLMITACFLGVFIERETDSINILALAALVILVFWPQALFDLSFQLSFLALWGILVLSPILMTPFHRMNGRHGYRLVQFCMVSLAAILSTLLPVAYHFHRASVTGVVSNFVVVPLIGYGAVIAGFVALLISTLLPATAGLLVHVAGLLVKWSNCFLLWLDRIPQPPHFTPTLLDVFLVTGFLLLLTFVKNNRNRSITALLLLLLLTAEHFPRGGPELDKVTLDFLSLGQCESTLVRLQDGRTILVDGGGSPFDGGTDVGERLLAPTLWSLGVDRIDYMVLSHLHPDHLKGLIFIAENFPVGEFWESGYPSEIPTYLNLKQILAGRGVPVRMVNSAASPFSIGRCLVEPLAPWPPTGQAKDIIPGEGDLNDESVVFRLSSGRFSVLFTGDSGFPTEAYLLKSPERLKSTVLKVAHHGSRRSTSLPFIKAVSPRIALISAGYRNSFHLPASETVADLSGSGAFIYRTDIDGTIELSANTVTGAVAVSRIIPSLR